MFTKQGGKFEQALIEGGMSPLAANDAMATIANCAAPLVHRGPITFDYTPKNFGFVTPKERKFEFPNLDDIRIPRRPSSPPPQPKKKIDPPKSEPQQPRPKFEPRQTEPSYGDGGGGFISAGRYITISNQTISANIFGGSGQLAVIGGNSLTGTTMKITSGNPKVLRCTQAGGPASWLIAPQGEYIDLVTGVEIEDQYVLVKTRRAFVLDPGPVEEDTVEMKEIEYISDVIETGSALEFKRRRANVLRGDDTDAGQITIPLVDCTV